MNEKIKNVLLYAKTCSKVLIKGCDGYSKLVDSGVISTKDMDEKRYLESSLKEIDIEIQSMKDKIATCKDRLKEVISKKSDSDIHFYKSFIISQKEYLYRSRLRRYSLLQYKKLDEEYNKKM